MNQYLTEDSTENSVEVTAEKTSIFIWQSLVVSGYRSFFSELAKQDSFSNQNIILIGPDSFVEQGQQLKISPPFTAPFLSSPQTPQPIRLGLMLRAKAFHVQFVIFKGLARALIALFRKHKALMQSTEIDFYLIAEPYSVTAAILRLQILVFLLFLKFSKGYARSKKNRTFLYTAQNIKKNLPFPLFILQHLAFGWCDGILSCGKTQIEVLKASGFKKPVIDFPLWYDSSIFSLTQTASLQCKFADMRLLVVYAGSLLPEKGIDDLFDALALLPKEQSQIIKTVIAGNGPLLKHLETRASALIAQFPEKRFRIKIETGLGQNELAALFNRANCIVAPSRTESHWKEQFGRVIVEAQACGAQVIATQTGEIPFVAADVSLLVPERDPTSLAKKICEVITQQISLSEAEKIELRIRTHQKNSYFSDAACAKRFAKIDDARSSLNQQPSTSPFADDRVFEGRIQYSSIVHFCKIAFKSKLNLSVGVLGLAMGAAAWTSTSWLSGKLADRLIILSQANLTYAQDSQVRLLLVAVFSAVLFMYFGNRYGRLCINQSLITAMQKIHDQAFKHTIETQMLFFHRTSTGRILSRFSSDYANAANAFDRIIATFIYAILTTLFSLSFILYSKPLLILIGIPFCVVLFYVSRLFGRRARDQQRLASRSNAFALGLFGEALAGTHLIRSFGVSSDFKQRLGLLQNNASNLSYRALQTANTRSLVQALVALVLTGCAMIVSYRSVQAGHLTLGQAGANVTLLMLILRNFMLIVDLLSTLETGFTSVERLNEYIELSPEESMQTLKTTIRKPTEANDSNDAVLIQNLEARYAADLPLVLKNLSTRIQSGERIGLVGRTGSGKTTLVQALYRLIPVAKGQIFLAGKDISTLSLGELRSSLAIVPQDPVLFAGSLLDNICHQSNEGGLSTEARRTAAWTALEKVNLASWIQSLPQGLDTEINERGSNLSHGQKQLICLARALASDPLLLILDEATSSVDPETEQLVTTAVQSATQGKTTLIIAHHLSTVESCDRILFMEAGTIVEDGPPQYLIADKNSRFAKLRAAALEKGGRID